jgi:hypothetical protein
MGQNDFMIEQLLDMWENKIEEQLKCFDPLAKAGF